MPPVTGLVNVTVPPEFELVAVRLHEYAVKDVVEAVMLDVMQLPEKLVKVTVTAPVIVVACTSKLKVYVAAVIGAEFNLPIAGKVASLIA